MSIILSRYESPIGPLTLASEGDTLLALEFSERAPDIRPRLETLRPDVPVEEGRLPKRIAAALDAYFAGTVAAIDDLVVKAEGGTPFQQKVWAALRRIPVGQTWSYARLAREVGRPGASRAVGSANGRNPIALVVPCHRVINTGGKLGGYGGGLDRKEWLLRHERALIA